MWTGSHILPRARGRWSPLLFGLFFFFFFYLGVRASPFQGEGKPAERRGGCVPLVSGTRVGSGFFCGGTCFARWGWRRLLWQQLWLQFNRFKNVAILGSGLGSVWCFGGFRSQSFPPCAFPPRPIVCQRARICRACRVSLGRTRLPLPCSRGDSYFP